MTATYATKSREFGPITFSAPAATGTYRGYVWMDGPALKDRRQIVYGGDFSGGNTVTATTGELKAAAQRWMRERRRWQKTA